MNYNQSISAFSALSQQTRLNVFRLLVKAGDDGIIAGKIAKELGIRQNTMSTNLSILMNAGLVRNGREGRSIRYYADFEGVRGLLAFLMEDCCGGNPELCQPVIEEITCDC